MEATVASYLPSSLVDMFTTLGLTDPDGGFTLRAFALSILMLVATGAFVLVAKSQKRSFANWLALAAATTLFIVAATASMIVTLTQSFMTKAFPVLWTATRDAYEFIASSPRDTALFALQSTTLLFTLYVAGKAIGSTSRHGRRSLKLRIIGNNWTADALEDQKIIDGNWPKVFPELLNTGIVRIPNLASRHFGQIPRGNIVRLSVEGRRVFRVIEYAPIAGPECLVLDYTAAKELGIAERFNQPVEIEIRQGQLFDRFRFLWDHPNYTTKTEFQIAVSLAALTLLLGVIVGGS